MLLDPFEEQLDFPALVVDRSNRGRRDLKVIGEEDKPAIDIDSVETDTAEQSGKRVGRMDAC